MQKETKIEIDTYSLRTEFHVGDAGHRPLRNITIEHICFIKRCSNHLIIIVIQKEDKRPEQIPMKKKIGNNV